MPVKVTMRESAAAVSPAPLLRKAGLLSLHPLIETNPDAVFIKRTRVAVKTDAQAKTHEGAALARDLFVSGGASGLPLPPRIAVKPNLTNTFGKGTTPEGMGIVTDAHFMEGLIEGMKGAGFQADRICVREGNWLADGVCGKDMPMTGYVEMAERTGVQMLEFPTGRRIRDLKTPELMDGAEVVWKDVPDGVVFRRVGVVDPFNQPDAWLLNVAKLKAHGMGMTLCVKNLQGICVSPHIFFCEGLRPARESGSRLLRDLQPDVERRVAELHARHRDAGYARWDRPGDAFNSGYGMEMWCQRICDLHSVTPIGLNIVEGIYGRNGNGFMQGPGPGGLAEDFMTNVLIFGKDAFRVDIVGTWLAGHDPSKFGLFHIARERGLSTVADPMDIPVYLWEGGNPKRAPLTDFDRTPITTPYMPRDYNRRCEPQYHLVNE